MSIIEIKSLTYITNYNNLPGTVTLDGAHDGDGVHRVDRGVT